MPPTYASAFSAECAQRYQICGVKSLHARPELRGLRDEEMRLSRLLGPAALSTHSAGLETGLGRVNWRQVLAKLPKEFGISDLRKIGALRNKQSSEIYNEISRWTDAGLVERKGRGVYQRLS